MKNQNEGGGGESRGGLGRVEKVQQSEQLADQSSEKTGQEAGWLAGPTVRLKVKKNQISSGQRRVTDDPKIGLEQKQCGVDQVSFIAEAEQVWTIVDGRPDCGDRETGSLHQCF